MPDDIIPNGNRVTIREVYTLLEEMRKEAKADRAELRDEIRRNDAEMREWIRQLKADAEGTHASIRADIATLQTEMNGRDDKPGVRGRLQTLETRTTIAHGGQALLTAIAAGVAAWLGMKQ